MMAKMLELGLQVLFWPILSRAWAIRDAAKSDRASRVNAVPYPASFSRGSLPNSCLLH